MKNNFVFLLALTFALAGCSKPAAEKTAESAADKTEAKSGVTMDAETQARIGLKIESPIATQWQSEIHATGRVLDPLQFVTAVAELETSRATGSALAQKSVAAKFAADWGAKLAAQTRLMALAESWQAGEMSLVKLSLPTGSIAAASPGTAELFTFGNETNAVAAEFLDDLQIDSATQMPVLLYSVKQKLAAGLAVTARIKISGESTSGVTIPANTIVRHEGAAWAYVQTQTNQFSRVEISLDCPADGGWFVKEKITTNSRVVVEGAQALLSAEFSTGESSHEH
jgi:hypothetical protein